MIFFVCLTGQAILETNMIDYSPFSPTLLEGISEKFVLSEHELAQRRDLRLYR
jgi:hypothetical protein